MGFPSAGSKTFPGNLDEVILAAIIADILSVFRNIDINL